MAYMTGISESLQIDDVDIIQIDALSYIFRSNVETLIKKDVNDNVVEKLFKEVGKYTKPIILSS